MLTRWLKRIIVAAILLVTGALCARIVMTMGGPELQPWHTFVPDEMRAEDINQADWEGYISAESHLFR